MELTIKKLSPSGKSGFAVVTRKFGFATIDVAAGYVRVDEGTKAGDSVALPQGATVSTRESVSDEGTCTWLEIAL